MKKSVRKILIGLCLTLVLVLGAIFSAPINFNTANATTITSSSVKTQKGDYTATEITSTQAVAVGQLSKFTAQFNTVFTPTTDNVTYSLSVTNGGGSVSLPQATSIVLYNLTDASNKQYAFTLNTSRANVPLEYFVSEDGITTFDANYVGGTQVAECFQVMINFNSVTNANKLATGSYNLVLTRTDGSDLTTLSAAFTLIEQTTTYSIAASKQHATVYTESAEKISLTVTPSNAEDTAISQKGRGIKVSLTNYQTQESVAIPATTKIELYDSSNVLQGTEWGTEKPYSFTTTEAFTASLNITIPYNVLPNGTYNLIIELYTTDGQTLATKSILMPLNNVSYFLKSSLKTKSTTTYAAGLIYDVGVSSLAAEITENLPSDAKIAYSVEKRTYADSIYSFAELTTKTTKIAIATFRSSLSSTNGLTKGLQFANSTAYTAQGVYRIRFYVYDRDDELKANDIYSYFVVLESQE